MKEMINMEFILQAASGDEDKWAKRLTELGFTVKYKKSPISSDWCRWFIEVPDLNSLIKIVEEKRIVIGDKEGDYYMLTIYDFWLD